MEIFVHRFRSRIIWKCVYWISWSVHISTDSDCFLFQRRHLGRSLVQQCLCIRRIALSSWNPYVLRLVFRERLASILGRLRNCNYLQTSIFRHFTYTYSSVANVCRLSWRLAIWLTRWLHFLDVLFLDSSWSLHEVLLLLLSQLQLIRWMEGFILN